MADILIAEDSATQAAQIKHQLAAAGYGVEIAANGAEALRAMDRKLPDLVLTDLQMPEMNGLELVEAVRRRYPRVPVVLMTAFGSEEVASRALEAGAASYVPKQNLDKDLLETIRDVLGVVQANRDQARLSEFLTEYETQFVLNGSASSVMPIIAHLQHAMAELKLVDENERTRVGVALETALQSALSGRDAQAAATAAQSAGGAPRVYLDAQMSRAEATFTLRREGTSWDSTKFIRDSDAVWVENQRDQWWLLVRSFMDEVDLDPAGSRLRMIKRGIPLTNTGDS